jgi:phospholipid-binding lipoprotein MlaA
LAKKSLSRENKKSLLLDASHYLCYVTRKTLRLKNKNNDGDFKMQNKKLLVRLATTVLVGSLAACTGAVKDPRDPLENWNREVQSLNDRADEYVMKPVATGYRFIMPSFVDQGVTNLFSNVNEIGVVINDVLQFKLAQAGLDSSRLLVNSVAGLGGLVDVGDMIGLEKHKEDFDQTLGVWGVPTEPYVVLPFLGPSSPRGIVGRVGDAAMNPVNYVGFTVSGAVSSAVSGGTNALKILDVRADHLGAEKVIQEAAEDHYEFIKNSYFQQRDYLVNDGEDANKTDVMDSIN